MSWHVNVKEKIIKCRHSEYILRSLETNKSTKFVEKSPPWRARSSSAGRKIPAFYTMQRLFILFLRILSQMNPVHTILYSYYRSLERIHGCIYTGCPRRNVPDFGRVFLRSNYTDITQNTYIQSWTVTEIMAREVWNFDSYYSLIDYQIHIETGRNVWFL